jgi:hypothetical protein
MRERSVHRPAVRHLQDARQKAKRRHSHCQLRDLLGLGFTGFNFLFDGPDPTAAMRQTAEEVLAALRSAG